MNSLAKQNNLNRNVLRSETAISECLAGIPHSALLLSERQNNVRRRVMRWGGEAAPSHHSPQKVILSFRAKRGIPAERGLSPFVVKRRPGWPYSIHILRRVNTHYLHGALLSAIGHRATSRCRYNGAAGSFLRSAHLLQVQQVHGPSPQPCP